LFDIITESTFHRFEYNLDETLLLVLFNKSLSLSNNTFLSLVDKTLNRHES